jgi:hypothetical protein
VDARERRFEYQGIVVGQGKGRSISLVGLCASLGKASIFRSGSDRNRDKMRKKINFHLLESCHSLQGTYYRLKESVHL